MIEIKELKKPNLETTKMNCDNVINKKLLDYPMTSDVFSTNSYNLVIGPMGTGKTSLITSWLKSFFKKAFECIYVIIPENSRMSIENDIYGKNLPEDQLYSDLTEGNLMQIYENLQENAKEGYNSFLLIDDFQWAMKSPEIISILQKIISKHRHLKTTIFLLQQNFQALAKPLRELMSNLIIFNCGKSQMTKVFDEVITLEKHKYQELMDVAFQDKHDWLLFNLNKSKKIYRNFDEIVFQE